MEEDPMTVSRSDTPVSAESAVSRRTMLGVTVTGAAITLLSRGVPAVGAQEATPMAEEGGLPPGVGVQPLITVPLKDLPSTPVNLELIQLTMEPGADSPATSAHGVVEVGYVQSGTLTCPGGEGRAVYAPDGTITASGAGDLVIPAGSAWYVPPDALDGARNDGTEPVSALLIHFPPMEDEATPTT
jgi:mannose-6-phosphate isomerase-like protein (cupin superfamily)